MLPFIDTHAHLTMLSAESFSINALFAEGFGAIVDVGTRADDLPGRLAALSGFERVAFSAGQWPDASAIAQRGAAMALLETHIKAAPPERLVAIGECGLDRHHNTAEHHADIAGEQELLDMHLDLAQRLGLPVIIHSREAAEETRRILARHPEVRGIIHCFSYGVAEARGFLDLGYSLSFAGTLTYKSAHPQREALCFTPPDRLLLETDSPFLAPVPFRGKRANPAMIAETYQAAAALRGMTAETLVDLITVNAAAIFGRKNA
ncbi:MAG: TatD family hydrolase [Treponema sp.]|jgi:TatD DNase family protein|nr:TatD family hydrolase [Treponema sp.]